MQVALYKAEKRRLPVLDFALLKGELRRLCVQLHVVLHGQLICVARHEYRIRQEVKHGQNTFLECT